METLTLSFCCPNFIQEPKRVDGEVPYSLAGMFGGKAVCNFFYMQDLKKKCF